jgi:DNA-binding CsgD family transcriptional regulator
MNTTTGLLLLNSSLDQIDANIEALKILFYPENLRKLRNPDVILAKRIRSVLLKKGSRLSFVSGLRSGRRQYGCRPFLLESPPGSSGEKRFALLIERGQPESPSKAGEVFDKFKLTKREREVVGWLVEGLTTREMADRMKISPNTVKVFVKLVMMKMGVTTRSGIVGALLSGNQKQP